LPLQLYNYCSLICLGLRVIKNLDILRIVSLFLFPPTIPNDSPLKDKKRLISIDAIYIYIDLESSFIFILATSHFLNLDHLSTFLVECPYAQEVKSKRHLIYISNLREL
jgi:hypothetical protein